MRTPDFSYSFVRISVYVIQNLVKLQYMSYPLNTLCTLNCFMHIGYIQIPGREAGQCYDQVDN